MMPDDNHGDPQANPSPVNANGQPPPQQPEEAAESFTWGDGLDLHVTNDRMTVTLEVLIDYAHHYTPEDLQRYLDENNVKHGIDGESLRRILDEQLYNQPIKVAFGTEPAHGNDGHVEWEVDLSILEGAHLKEKGARVDYKEKHHVLPIKENQPLARLIPATEGTSGTNVHGEPINASRGKDAKFPAGKGMRLSEAGEQLFAAMSGVLCREGEKYSVSSTYDVQGDVNYKSGNVNYEGTVLIRGGVLSDFKVIVGQDLHIEGLVEGATIVANGNIYITGGIQGDQKASIRAGGDIFVKFIQNATVQAGGDIVVQNAITQSLVQAHKKVIVEGPKGVIVGGHVIAEHEISTAFLGAEIGTKTLITLGKELQTLIELQHEREIKAKTFQENEKKLLQAANQLNRLRDQGKLPASHEPMRLKLTRGLMQLKGKEQNLQKEMKAD